MEEYEIALLNNWNFFYTKFLTLLDQFKIRTDVKPLILYFLLTLTSTFSFSQSERLFPSYLDSTEYRIILKTQEKNGNEFVTLDVFTIKSYKDSTKVYYVRYGDMLISSLMMEYSILDEMIAFEQTLSELACTEKTNCPNRILIEGASKSYSVPIDLLNEELLSNLMLKLEN